METFLGAMATADMEKVTMAVIAMNNGYHGYGTHYLTLATESSANN